MEEIKTKRPKYYCLACSKELSWAEVMYSEGKCPKCGYKPTDNAQIVPFREE